MVQVQSSWFPLYDRNPQTFVPNVFFAHPADYVKATQRVYRSGKMASRIEVLVVK
jgi:predicted acyl esterase